MLPADRCPLIAHQPRRAGSSARAPRAISRANNASTWVAGLLGKRLPHDRPAPVNRPSPRASWRGTATLIARKWVHSPVVVTAIRDEANLLARPPPTRRLRHASPAAPPTGAAPAARPRPAPTAGPRSTTPNTSVASQRIVPGEPSGKSITNNNTPFHRLNDFAASSRPNNGCVSATTRTSHGKTARNCCSLSPSLLN